MPNIVEHALPAGQSPIPKCLSTAANRQTPALTVDFSASNPKAARVIKSTQKRKENDDRANAARDAEIEALKKQVLTLKKKHEKTKSELRERDVNRAPPESEEEDDEPVDMSGFSSSFVSRGVVSRRPPKAAPKRLRSGKAGETPIATPMPRVALTSFEDDLNDVHDQAPSDGAASDGAEGPDLGAGVDTPSSNPRLHAQQKRARSSSPDPKRSKKKKKVEDPLPQAEFVAGHAPGGSRTNLKDYTEPARKLLKRAMHTFEVRVWSRSGYPPAEVQVEWVKQIWVEVCEAAGERMELTKRMSSMIRKYGPHGRSSLKDGVRPLVGPMYRFKVGDSPKTIQKNLKIHKQLLDESGFHYEDPKERTGYAKNKIIIESIRTLWFKNKSSRGVLNFESFSPISLVTLALIFTVIEFCIEEYSTGRFQQGIFDELLNKDCYETHLKDLTEWAALKPTVTTALLQRMHNTCRASTGAALVKTTGRMTDAARAKALAELEAMDIDGDGGDGNNDSDDE
ncbi:hypothetical protein MVEN_00909200 [Mycena venus]|uniref:DUF6532 domain-containing protein n=1 Tax=Mycena venus TaxID=2733690 RepID=A0A8H7CZC3_9AGAR|nr:hypothetical protein MVEN_00909200 [Mycena venus]